MELLLRRWGYTDTSEWRCPARAGLGQVDASSAGSQYGRPSAYACLTTEQCTEIQLYDPGLRAELFDSLVRPILLHGAGVWGATRQIGLTTFGSQERDPTEQVHRSFFGSLLG
jgi:hypothetical protein